MTPEAFRAALADLGFSQVGFARLLTDHGHTAKAATVERSVRRWCKDGGPGPTGEAVVILALLRERQTQRAA